MMIHCFFWYCSNKVNVRTGRKGYYKRTQATDKTTAMKICLHDSDDAIGVDSDLHNRIYAKSSKALGHKDSSLDALDLPFFQLGKHPNQVHPAHVAVQALPSIPGPLALGDGRGAQPMDTPALQNADVDDDDDDDDDKALPAAMNPIQLIHHAIPNMQKQRAEAKAKASAAKASAAKASSKSRGEKRKKGGVILQRRTMLPKKRSCDCQPRNLDQVGILASLRCWNQMQIGNSWKTFVNP